MKKYVSIIVLTILLFSLASCYEGEYVSSLPEGTSEAESYVPSVSTDGNSDLPADIAFADISDMDFSFSERDRDGEIRKDEIKEASSTADGYEITSEGTYIFSGTITDKTISVKAGDDDKVQIVLDGANISNSKGVAIYIGNADKVFITLADGSENTVCDGSDYSVSDSKSELDAAIFSRADLVINGSGSLKVLGRYKHGIVSKDDLKILGAALSVESQKVGLNGKDCVKISDATLDISAGTDGIRSDNDEDSDRGFVYIESGKIKINAGNDGIQAETALKIENGELDIVSGGGSKASLKDADESYKGIKAGLDILINGGKLKIDSLDDSLHSDNSVCISGGSFALSTRDDGIHANADLLVSGGEIKISGSYEGLEATRLFLTGGDIDIVASDDGMNAAGGADLSGGKNPFSPSGSSTSGERPAPPAKPDGFGNDIFGGERGEITVSGGYIHINASGDGIDSNGNFNISGGVLLVSGPTGNGNGTLDYDGSATVSGGVLIAVGSAGMAQNMSEAVNQGAIFSSFSYRSGGTNIALCDENGKAIAVFKPQKDYQCAIISAPEIQKGGKYSLYAAVNVSEADKNGFARNVDCSGGTHIEDIVMTSLLYGNPNGFAPGGPGGGDHGGGPGGRR